MCVTCINNLSSSFQKTETVIKEYICRSFHSTVHTMQVVVLTLQVVVSGGVGASLSGPPFFFLFHLLPKNTCTNQSSRVDLVTLV